MLMTLNEARARLLAADKLNRSICVSAQCWAMNHKPGRPHTTFAVSIHDDAKERTGLGLQQFGASTLDGVVERALAFLGDPSAATVPLGGADEPAAATEEGDDDGDR